MTAREIADTLVAGKAPERPLGSRLSTLQAAILAAPRKRDGAMVIGAGAPARRLKRADWGAGYPQMDGDGQRLAGSQSGSCRALPIPGSVVE